ncbi:hypothetical protein [Confluentibacter flavum]|nr:hypothetical protein [Confluentibacter flavum]
MKTKILRIVGCLILGMLPVLILNLIPHTNHKNESAFIRRFPPHFLANKNTINIKTNRGYITGMDSSKLYIGYATTPLKLSSFQWDYNEFLTSSFSIKDSFPIAWKVLKNSVFENHIYLMEGLTPNIFESSLEKNVLFRKKIDSVTFTDCLPLSTSLFIVKTFNTQRTQQVLALLREGSNNLHIPNMNLKKQVDGFFCVDGDLIYNKEAERIIYTYRYRNEFLIFDSNLKFLYAENTIDPNFQAQIKVSSIKEHGMEKIILTAPPHVVNKKSFSQGQWLFINSNIISKNEDQLRFHSKSVIDIYELESGDYKYSFYIPSYEGLVMKDFAFYNNTLAVLYDQGIIVFNMGITKN